jgi:hypothetical protein
MSSASAGRASGSRDVSVSDCAVTVKASLCDADFYLRPGEEVALPSVICPEGGEVSDARRQFRALLRESFSPRTRLGDKLDIPLAIQPFDRYFRHVPEWATEAGQLKHVNGLYRLWATLLDAFPGLLIHNCSSGGSGFSPRSSGLKNTGTGISTL